MTAPRLNGLGVYVLPFFLTVLLSLGGWNLSEIITVRTRQATVLTTLEMLKENDVMTRTEDKSYALANEKSHDRILAKIDEMLPRKEAELRFAQLEVRIKELEMRIANVELRMAELALELKKLSQ